MTRRRLVALVSVAVLFTLGLLVVGTITFFTRTGSGRDQFRRIAQRYIDSRVRGGTVYLGRVTGSFLTGITFDSLAIRDKRGDLLVSTGRATFSYDPRDLMDNRIYIRRAQVEHPFVNLVQHANGVWNFKEIFASRSTGPAKPKDPSRRALGDYLVIDSTFIRNGSLVLTLPWRPDASLRGAARDSSIRVHLTNPAKAVVKTFDGYGRRYVWTNARGLVTHARLADPDSDRTFGQQFQIGTLSADEFEPTFKFRNISGEVRRLADSAWFKVSHFDMPASTGTGAGKVWWGHGPMHYDIAIHGDSVSLDDVNWVYPDLPRMGGGKLDLLIQNDPADAHIVDFKLVNMDVRSTKSHLTGTMSFGIGAPVLLVRNVNLRGDPVDFDLLRTLAGKPFPVDWQGQIIGTAKGPGGPLTHFVLDDARAVFRDAHVPGAESRFSAKGELDILLPAFTVFHGFDVDVASLDLRTIEYLYPSFPRLGGTVSGTATLDSSWLDVRFSNADLTHRDGPGDPSHVTGNGRVTYGEKFMTYDVTLDAEPLSMTMLARSYQGLPLRGLFSGPIRASGSSPDLTVSTSLQSAHGAVSFDGRVDIDTIGGMSARGAGQFSALNLTALLEKAKIPANTLSGHYELDVDSIGDNLATLHGSANVVLDRSMFDGIRLNPSRARVRFVDGQVRVDTLEVNSPAFTFAVQSGGIGLPNGRPDSLRFTLDVDSLGGLRFLARADSVIANGDGATLPDSITGSLSLRNGIATGRLDSLLLRGTVRGNGLYFDGYRAESATLSFDLHDMPKVLAGTISMRVDTATVVGVVLDSIGATVNFSDFTHARFDAGAVSRNGPSASATGNWSSVAGANEVFLSALNLGIGEGRWTLAGPTRLAFDSSAVVLDSLMLRNGDSAVVAVRGRVPQTGPASGELRATRIPLRDLGIVAQLADTITGVGDVRVTVAGTKTAPLIDGDVALSSIKWSGLDISSAVAKGQFRDKRLNVDGDVVVKGKTALTGFASLPIDLSLFSAQWGRDSLTGFIRADSADLSIIQAFVGQGAVNSVSGRVAANVRVRGTPQAKTFDGSVAVTNGSVFVVATGVTISNISGTLSGETNAAGQDSVHLDLSAATEGRPSGNARIQGWAKNLLAAEPTFNFQMGLNQFHAINRRSLADLYLSTTRPIVLTGSVAAPNLEGALLVDRTSIYLPDRDIARKQAVQFITEDTIGRVGTFVRRSAMLSTLKTNLVPNVTVTLGNDVRLRSKEANVRLSGELHVAKSAIRSTRTLASGEIVPDLTLEGALRTEGGTYNLDLGLVQREFQVLSGGTVTFTLAESPKNPTLDIKARHNIKQQTGDLGIIVNLHGPLYPYPVIDFSATGVDYEIPPSDLVSYLLIGKPGFDFLQNPASTQVLASFLAPTVSAVAADRLRRSFGSWFNVLQLQLGGSGAQDQSGFFSKENLSQYFYGATISAEQQFRNNLYLSVNTGFCRFQDPNGVRLNNALSDVGAKVEWRADPRLAVQFAYDPATANRACSGGQSVFSLAPSPPNFSFSLSHVWRF